MEVRSVYLTLLYFKGENKGGVLHEIQISKDGKVLLKSTQEKPAPPDRLLFDKTKLPFDHFIHVERIGSKLYVFPRKGGVAKLAYTFDPKSPGEELVSFHDLPNYLERTCPIIMAAHGRLYHLANPLNITWDVPMPFEVYDPSTKSWHPLPPLPRSPFIPYREAPRHYMGYAVWDTYILVSLGYPGMCASNFIFVPLLFNVESRKWHQLNVDRVGTCFPWRGKATVVGDTAYAVGYTVGSIMSFSINKSGSEDDGTLVYSLQRPYRFTGLKLMPHPTYTPDMFTLHFLAPLGEFEFCLVQTLLQGGPKFQPFWIATFKIIQARPFDKILTLHSTFLFMDTLDDGHFLPIFCYNPDYEPKEVMLTTTEDILKERNMIQGSSNEVDCDILGSKIKETSLTNRKNWGFQAPVDRAGRVVCMPRIEPKEESLTTEKVDMSNKMIRVNCIPGNVKFLKIDFELGGASATVIEGESIEIKASPSEVDSNLWDFPSKESVSNRKMAKRRRRKVKVSKKKASKGDSYFDSIVKHQVSRVKLYGERRYVAVACLVILLVNFLFGVQILFLGKWKLVSFKNP